VDRRFAADEWVSLSPAEQIRRCRLLAAEAYKLAAQINPKLAPGFEQLAKQWSALADQMSDLARANHQSR
jgi:hypothetical protein